MSQKINELQSLGFFAREKPQWVPTWSEEELQELSKKMQALEDTPVQILRPILFFHSEQKGITLKKLKEFFSDKAIELFKIDGYIKIQDKK